MLYNSMGIYYILYYIQPLISYNKGCKRVKIEYQPLLILLINNKEQYFNYIFIQDSTNIEIFNILWPILNIIIKGRYISLIALGRIYSGKIYTIIQLLSIVVSIVLSGSFIYKYLQLYIQFIEIYRKDKYLYNLGGNIKTIFQYNKVDYRYTLEGYRYINLKEEKDIKVQVYKIDCIRVIILIVENKSLL